jgi:hypothetical protein
MSAHFYVEGIYLTRKGVKKARKSGRVSAADLEPFARSYWVENPQAAIDAATQDLEGGEWQEGPRVSQHSEEQRMRASGAPELPGLLDSPRKGKRKGTR